VILSHITTVSLFDTVKTEEFCRPSGPCFQWSTGR